MLIIDGHEDIAWNAVCFGRDYMQSALLTRRSERGSAVPGYVGNATLGRTEWLLGRVGVVFATIFVAPAHTALGPWDSEVYSSPREAYEQGLKQIDLYQRLADEHELFELIGDQADLERVLASWETEGDLAGRRIGLVPLLEGADPIREPELAEEWYERGLRIVGLAWEGTQYAGGTHEPGPLTKKGEHLLEVMAGLGMILDLSHLAEEAYFQALERYDGVVIASHANARHFVPTTRGLSDEMILSLAERDGVIGTVAFNFFLRPGHPRWGRKDLVSLTDYVDAIDYVCQLTGSANHVAIGSDLDGGYGVEETPAELDTVADLRRIVPLLEARGYGAEQITAICSGNWLRVLRRGLPA